MPEVNKCLLTYLSVSYFSRMFFSFCFSVCPCALLFGAKQRVIRSLRLLQISVVIVVVVLFVWTAQNVSVAGGDTKTHRRLSYGTQVN